jgi:hypothetical protein
LPARPYDSFRIRTHEFGHIVGYGDLDPAPAPGHIMAGRLYPAQPWPSRASVANHRALDPLDAFSDRFAPVWFARSRQSLVREGGDGWWIRVVDALLAGFEPRWSPAALEAPDERAVRK